MDLECCEFSLDFPSLGRYVGWEVGGGGEERGDRGRERGLRGRQGVRGKENSKDVGDGEKRMGKREEERRGGQGEV